MNEKNNSVKMVLQMFLDSANQAKKDIAKREVIEELEQFPLQRIESNPILPKGFELQPYRCIISDVMIENQKGKIPMVSEEKYGIKNEKGEVITNFKIEIEKVKTCEDDKQKIDFTVFIRDGQAIHLTKLVEEFRAGVWYKGDARLNCTNLQQFCLALEKILLGSEINVLQEYNVPGWYKENGVWNYYNTNENVLANANSNIKISQISAGAYPVFQDEEKLAQHFWNMQNLTKGPQAKIVMSYVLLASLYSIFKDAGVIPKGVLGLIGPQSSRKTSLAMTLASLNERSASMSPKYNMRSTPASIEEALEEYKDAVLIVDDLSPSEDASHKKQLERTLEHVVRIFGDANTRKRSKKYDKTYEPCGLCIITGEYINAVASTLSRVLIVEMDTSTVDLDVLTFYQQNYDILPGFLWKFLTFCANNQEQIIEFLKREYPKKRQQIRGKYNPDRLGEYKVELEVTVDIFLMYLRQFPCFATGVLDDFMAKFSSDLNQILRENEKAQNEKQPFSQIQQCIKKLLYENKIYDLSQATREIKHKFYMDQDFFYLQPTKLLKSIEEYMQERGENTAITDVRYLEKVLENSGCLICSNEVKQRGVYCKRRSLKLPNANKIEDFRRFYHIPIKKILNEASD